MEKVIIAIYGRSNSGKTQSIKHYARNAGGFLNMSGKPVTVNPTNSVDIFGTIALSTALIGVASQGDPGTGLANRL